VKRILQAFSMGIRIDGGKSMADENLKAVYQELCTSYRAVDDFRAKLLGFLPFATGAGVFLLVAEEAKLDSARQFLFPIGVFGFVITLGLFSYELYGIKKCHHLIRTGSRLEDSLKNDGQFKQRPREVFHFINEPFAAGVIYSAVLAAWTFLATVSTWPQVDPPYAPQYAQSWAICVFFVGLAGSLYFNFWLKLGGEATDTLKLKGEVSFWGVIAYLKLKYARLPETEKNEKMSELATRL